eukprot:640895_1
MTRMNYVYAIYILNPIQSRSIESKSMVELSTIVCACSSTAFWTFIFKTYLPDYIQGMKQDKFPANTLRSVVNVALSACALLFDDAQTMDVVLQAVIGWWTVGYEVTDCTRYQRGTTHVVWPMHHVMFILMMVPLLYSDDVPWITIKFLFGYEFGSNLFMLQLRSRAIQASYALSMICVILYVMTRIWIGYKLYTCWIDNILVDDSGRVIQFVCCVLMLPLNGWLAYKSIKRIIRNTK